MYSSIIGPLILLCSLALANNACFVCVAKVRKWRLERKADLGDRDALIEKLTSRINELENQLAQLATSLPVINLADHGFSWGHAEPSLGTNPGEGTSQ